MEFVQRFDPRRDFQYVNDEPSVLHCHHYATMITKLALQQRGIDGPKKLARSMEESFYLVLKKYFIRHNVNVPSERLDVGRTYYASVGLGDIDLGGDEKGGLATLKRSHLDEGWKKKWGTSTEAINYMTCGYLGAAYSTAHGKPIGAYQVREVSSIAMGAAQSEFEITLRENSK